ncbi:MAG: DUF547 domain-containing protein [Nevskiaceae bacterium]
MVLRAALLAALAGLAGCGAESPYVPPPMTGEPTPLHPPEEAWARVLKAAVDAQGRVDFNALIAVHADLDRYVAWIYERSPERWPELYRTRAHVIAFHVNAYNALALYNLLQAGLPASLSGGDRKRLYERRKMLVGGQLLSLSEYREQVIRALGEPRVHFAITSQFGHEPLLAREPYRAQVLDAQLDRAARAFFSDERHLRVEAGRRALVLSPILRIYAADFLAVAPSLAAYAGRYRDAPVPAGYAEESADFDWTLRHAGALPRP